MSALQMRRTLDVSYETAWYLCHRIRAAMREINSELLRGIIELLLQAGKDIRSSDSKRDS
jgi:hypothetical protein